MKNFLSLKIPKPFQVLGILFLLFCVLNFEWIANVGKFYYSASEVYFFSKKLAGVYQADNMLIKVYAETRNGKNVKILNSEKIAEIAKEVQNNFPKYMAERHPEVSLPPFKSSSVSLLFVNKNVFDFYDKMESTAACAFYIKQIKYALFPAPEMEYDILKNKDTISHELFHHLVGIYGIKLKDEEYDAARFERFTPRS